MDFLQREEGQGLVEYALILVLIAIVVIAVLVVFGDPLAEWYKLIANMFP
jgi:pilus assembly protein Flp/PilA